MMIKLSQLIAFFKDAPFEVDADFENCHIVKSFPKGQIIAMEGEKSHYLPIVRTGRVRVYKLSPNGNEITLYRINPGESCILTISCLLTNKTFPAVALTETNSEILLIDSDTLKSWVNKYTVWRDFIFNYMSNIIFKVITLLESSTFSRTESRIIDFLLQKLKEEGQTLKYTHQKIASEIGTSREVVSRILKDLESKQIIKLSRGSVTILNKSHLQNKNLVIN